jgi:hypothetical protein
MQLVRAGEPPADTFLKIGEKGIEADVGSLEPFGPRPTA